MDDTAKMRLVHPTLTKEKPWKMKRKVEAAHATTHEKAADTNTANMITAASHDDDDDDEG